MKKFHDLETRVVGIFTQAQLAWPCPSEHVGGVLLGQEAGAGTKRDHEAVGWGRWHLEFDLFLEFDFPHVDNGCGLVMVLFITRVEISFW